MRIVDTRTSGFDEGHVPGAVHLDIAASRDADNPPSYLPAPEVFAERLRALGISKDTHVVFYDDRGGIYGTRPWVVLRQLGHEKASIVDGGWPKWTHEGRAVSRETVGAIRRGDFEPRPQSGWIATADDVAAAMALEAKRSSSMGAPKRSSSGRI